MRRLLVCAAACALVAAGCSGSGSKHGAASTSDSTFVDTTPAPKGSAGFQLLVDRPTVVSTGQPAHLTSAVAQVSVRLVRNYVILGMLDPITTGKLGPGFAALFAPDALAQITPAGNARLTVTDLGVRSQGGVKVRGKIHLTALGDAHGAVALVSIQFTVALRRGTLGIDRSGELLLARANRGHWAIIGYTLSARRAVAAAPATTTTAVHTPATPTTKAAP